MGVRSIRTIQDRARAIRGSGYPQPQQRSLSELPDNSGGGLKWCVVITAVAGDAFVSVKEVQTTIDGDDVTQEVVGAAEQVWCQPGMDASQYAHFAIGEEHADWDDYWIILPAVKASDGEWYLGYWLPLAMAPWPADSTYDIIDCWALPRYDGG